MGFLVVSLILFAIPFLIPMDCSLLLFYFGSIEDCRTRTKTKGN